MVWYKKMIIDTDKLNIKEIKDTILNEIKKIVKVHGAYKLAKFSNLDRSNLHKVICYPERITLEKLFDYDVRLSEAIDKIERLT